MKVILLKDLKIGRRYQIKEVADGFARQILIPRGEALLATPANLKMAEQKRREVEKGQANEESLAEEIKNKLTGLTVELKEKAGPEGQLFAKISPAEVAKVLKAKGVTLNSAAIELVAPIKHIGLHQAKARLTGGREAGFTILVSGLPD
ncbi:MAG: 50S ribosomal protein L9 [bacterium]|nr:50S ribosomal protein L9 [bacterium]